MNNTEFKLKFLQKLEETQRYFKPINSKGEYRLRCPLCGDSADERKAHFYIHIDLDDNSVILYNCFKCGRKGALTEDVVRAFGFTDPKLLSGCKTLNDTATKIDSKGVNTSILYKFNYKIPKVIMSEKTRYIEDRLGVTLTKEDFEDMKVITSIKEFLITNDISTVMLPNWLIDRIDKNYVGFITEGKSHILFRSITNNKKDYRWIKYPISKKSELNRVFYTMRSKVDMFTKDTIEINLAEGVFDILSATHNLKHNGNNKINIAVCGKNYSSVILHIINLGIVGDNVKVNIFADNDEVYNMKARDPTNIEYFKNTFKKTKFLFREVNVFYNTLSKDIGVDKEHISLERYKV